MTHYRRPLPYVLLVGLMLAAAGSSALQANEDWPQFRGPTQQGHSDSAGLPVEWSESRNVRWKTAIPGRGWSSPVVLGRQVWLTTATDLPGTGGGKSLRAVCVDRESG